MTRLCPPHLRPVVRDDTWRDAGAWITYRSQIERDTVARLIDRPAPTKFADVARGVARPTWRFITRMSRKCVAAGKAWRDAK